VYLHSVMPPKYVYSAGNVPIRTLINNKSVSLDWRQHALH
jgi:hypothetical protein